MVYASVWSVKSTAVGHTVGSEHLCPFCCLHPSCSCIGWLYSDHGHIGNLAKEMKSGESSLDLEKHILRIQPSVHIQVIPSCPVLKELPEYSNSPCLLTVSGQILRLEGTL